MKKSVIILLVFFMIWPAYTQEAIPQKQNNTKFPPQFDLRGNGNVSPVKDQGSCGCCWAFATMAAIESNWLMKGYGSYDLSEDNLINCQNYDNTPCYGGNFYMSSSMFGRHAGPVLESEDPYGDTTAIKNCPSGSFTIYPTAFIPDVRFIPNDMNTIKETLMNEGAIATTMIFDMAYYNPTNYTYLYGGTGGYNHCITVIGWDDNKQTASANNGAWLIKDSYGTGWAMGGYFYVSYDDPIMFTEAAIFPVRYPILPANPTYVYYEDEFGWIDNKGFSSTTGYGLAYYTIMPQQGNLAPQQVKRIGTYAVEANTELHIEVYSQFDGSTLSGLRYETDYSCEFPGFYTIPISLNTDTIFTDIYIKVKYETPANQNPIPVEIYEANYTSAIQLQTDHNWYSSDGTNWQKIGNNTSFPFDLCIKMYTEIAPVSRFDMPDTAMINEPVELISNCLPTGGIDSVNWFINGDYAGNAFMMPYVFTNPGDNEVSLIAYLGANSDESSQDIYIRDPQLMSIVPDNAKQGDMVSTSITGFDTQWNMMPPNVMLVYSANPAEVIPAAMINVTSNTSIEADFDIPMDATVGDWHVVADELVMENGFYVSPYVGLNENAFKELSIYPNPSQGILNIAISEKAMLSLFRVSGKKVFEKQLQRGKNILNLKNQDPGLYLIKVYSPEKTAWQKIVLQ